MKKNFARLGTLLLLAALLGSLGACSRGYDPAIHTEREKNVELEYGYHGTREVREFVPGLQLKTGPVFNPEQYEATMKVLRGMKLDQPTNYYVNQFGDAGLVVEDSSLMDDGFTYTLRQPESNRVYRLTLLNRIFPTRASEYVVEVLQPVAPGGQAKAIAAAARAEAEKMAARQKSAEEAAQNKNQALAMPEEGEKAGVETHDIARALSRYGELTGFQHLGHKSFIWIKTSPSRQVRLLIEQDIATDRIREVRLLNEFERVDRFRKT